MRPCLPSQYVKHCAAPSSLHAMKQRSKIPPTTGRGFYPVECVVCKACVSYTSSSTQFFHGHFDTIYSWTFQFLPRPGLLCTTHSLAVSYRCVLLCVALVHEYGCYPIPLLVLVLVRDILYMHKIMDAYNAASKCPR